MLSSSTLFRGQHECTSTQARGRDGGIGTYMSERCAYTFIACFVHTMYIPCTYMYIHLQKCMYMCVHVYDFSYLYIACLSAAVDRHCT